MAGSPNTTPAPEHDGPQLSHDHSHGHQYDGAAPHGGHHSHPTEHNGHDHAHSQGHGHDHSRPLDPHGEWDADKYIGMAGAIRWALQQVGASEDTTKRFNLLEVGCGPGLVTANLFPHFASLHAVDVSSNMLIGFSARLADTRITHSLHFLSPSSPTDFLTPLVSPTRNEPERKLQPPRAKFDVAVANLVLHHVGDWSGLMAGVQGLLAGGAADKQGGWFIGTEFGKVEGEKDVVEGLIEKSGRAAEHGAKEGPAAHAHIHHGAMTPKEMISKLKSYGFDEAYAEIRGEQKMWPEAPAVPNLVFWARRRAAKL